MGNTGGNGKITPPTTINTSNSGKPLQGTTFRGAPRGGTPDVRGFAVMDPVATQPSVAAARRVFDAINSGDLGQLDELIGPDFVDDTAGSRGDSGREQLKAHLAALRGALPDLSLSIKGVVVEGDAVAVMWAGRGSYRDSSQSLLPPPEAMTFQGVDILRFSDGKVTRRSGVSDLPELPQ